MDKFWNGILTSSIVVATFLIALLVFYYVMSYLGLKRRKDYLEDFQKRLKPGVKVLFAGGILGKVVALEEQFLTIEISKGNSLQVSRYSVTDIVE